MTIYLDYVLFINYFFDFLLLYSVKKILKRSSSIIRIILGALFGSISLFILFFKLSSFEILLIKLFISVFMIIISFSFKNIKYFFENIFYLYLTSIILSGFLYMINSNFSYKYDGFNVLYKKYDINIFIVIIISILFLFFYVKNYTKQKKELENKYSVEITLLNNKKIKTIAIKDTGCMIYDQYKKRPVCIINRYLIKDYNPNYILVPCNTINKMSLLKCFKIKKIKINNKEIKKEILLGISDNNFKINNVDLLLHKNII